MNDIMKLANGPAMWIFALIIIAIAIVESVLIYRRSNLFSDQTGLLTQKEKKACMKRIASLHRKIARANRALGIAE